MEIERQLQEDMSVVSKTTTGPSSLPRLLIAVQQMHTKNLFDEEDKEEPADAKQTQVPAQELGYFL